MPAQFFSINAAAELTGLDRRRWARVMRHTPPDSKVGGDKWRFPTMIAALLADVEGKSDGPNLTDARTRVALAKAETAERQNQQDAGEWVEIEDVIAMYTAEVMQVREHFLSLPGKACGPIANVDSIDAYRILHDEVWEALDAFADGKSSAAFIIAAIEKCGGRVSNPEAQALLNLLPGLYADLDEARKARRKNKTAEDQADA
jgi:hypothetical protein